MKLGHKQMIRGLLLASAAAVVMTNAPARAADLSAPLATPHGHEWDIAFGVTLTSDYISRGDTQTEGGAAIQPYAELTINDCFYVGYWGSNVSFAGTKGWESDLSVGVRPKLGPVSFDFGYVRYLYTNSASAEYGEAYAKASFSPFNPVTIGAAVFVNPANSDHYLELNGSVDLSHGFSASAAVGSNTLGTTTTTPWNAGVSWAPQDWVKFDGRYYAGPTANKFVAAVTFSTSAKTLGIFH